MENFNRIAGGTFAASSIDETAATLPYSQAEVGAYGHWMFQAGDSGGLTSIIGNRALVAQSTPTYAADYVSLDFRYEGDALISDFEDNDTTVEVTMAAVVRASINTGNSVVFGSYEDGTPGGFRLALGSGAVTCSSQGDFGFVTPPGLSFPTATWFFVAASKGIARDGAKSLSIYLGGVGSYINFDRDTYTPAGASRYFSFGNAYSGAGTGSGVLDVAEAILFDRFMGIAEINALYARSKKRMAAAGITVT
ncbi:hypothetical protein [Amorphus sp. MBR-141]